MSVCVAATTTLCGLDHLPARDGDSKDTDLQLSQGGALGPEGPCSMLSPLIISGSVLLHTKVQPPSKGRAAGEHMLDVTHGCTDTHVRNHAYKQQPPFPPQKTKKHAHTHFKPPESNH